MSLRKLEETCLFRMRERHCQIYIHECMLFRKQFLSPKILERHRTRISLATTANDFDGIEGSGSYDLERHSQLVGEGMISSTLFGRT